MSDEHFKDFQSRLEALIVRLMTDTGLRDRAAVTRLVFESEHFAEDELETVGWAIADEACRRLFADDPETSVAEAIARLHAGDPAIETRVAAFVRAHDTTTWFDRDEGAS